jgi:hypothetical protein
MSLETAWTPLKAYDPRQENAAEFVSASSSKTDFFSNYETDSEDEFEKERLDCDDLNFWENITSDSQTVVASNAERKQQLPSEISSWISEEIEGGDMFYETAIFPSFPNAYIFDDDTEDSGVDQYIRNLVYSFENVINTGEEECQASCMSREETNHVDLADDTDLVDDTALEKRVEKNHGTNTGEPSTMFTNRYDEIFSEDCFQIPQTISQYIMQENITDLDLGPHTQLLPLNAEQVRFNRKMEDFEIHQDSTVEGDNYLSNRKDIEVVADDGKMMMMMMLPLQGTQNENKTTKFAIETHFARNPTEEIKKIVFTKEEYQFPHSISKYFKQNEERCIGQAVPMSSRDIDTITEDNAISHIEQHLDWHKQTSIENVLLNTPYDRSIYTIAPPNVERLNVLREHYSAFQGEKDYGCQGERNCVVPSELSSFPGANKTYKYMLGSERREEMSATVWKYTQRCSLKISRRSSASRIPQPISKHSKTIIEDENAFHENTRRCGMQTTFEKACKLSSDTQSRIPRITYKMSKESTTSGSVPIQHQTKIQTSDGGKLSTGEIRPTNKCLTGKLRANDCGVGFGSGQSQRRPTVWHEAGRRNSHPPGEILIRHRSIAESKHKNKT